LLIGGVNTSLGYALLVLFEVTIGKELGYLVSLYLSYSIAIGLAFVLHRRFTFRIVGTGNSLIDLMRFSGVYVVALAANTLTLPLLIEIAGVPPLPAQAIVVMVTTILSYLGHKYFSFHRSQPPQPSVSDGPSDDGTEMETSGGPSV